jgi:HTH-type transcriptional repressor of NAD biosynthesis genes
LVDVIGIWLYYEKHIVFVSILYMIFLVLAIRGLNHWRKRAFKKRPRLFPLFGVTFHVRQGLIIGKFFPPHKGHRFLIETAASQVDALTVVVCDKRGESIPAKLRAKWVQEIHPKVRVLVVDDIGAEDDSKAWADYTLKFLGYCPDVIFTSEEYGERYAHFLGADHVLVDRKRETVPISGTAVRNNPQGSWEYLDPPVRGFFALRVSIVGAESTGKTTLAKTLADHFQTVWVPEFGRQYTEGKMTSGNTKWESEEFIFIAEKQNQIEDDYSKQCNKLLICDTDSFATSLWHERYLGFRSEKVDRMSTERTYALYLLAGDEIPFVQDGTRDGEHIRHDMQKQFEVELKKT